MILILILILIYVMVNILIVVEGAGTEDWPAEQRDDGNCQEKVREDYLDCFTAIFHWIVPPQDGDHRGAEGPGEGGGDTGGEAGKSYKY